LAEPERQDDSRRRKLESMANTVFVSAVTSTELMIKASLGQLAFDFNPMELAEQSGFEPLDFSGQQAMLLRDLPFHHRDPFDRMLIAQALQLNYHLMTDDSKIKLYGCKVI